MSNGVITIGEMLRCSKPLVFEDGFKDFEYSVGGTFFLAKFQGKFFAVSARHCVKDRDGNVIRIMFDELAENEKKFLPLRRLHVANDPPKGPEDYTDVAIMEIEDKHLTDQQKSSPWFVDLDHFLKHPVRLQKGDLLITRGFPHYLGGIDYDRRVIKIRGFAADGEYDGPTETDHVHVFRFHDLSQVTDISGISGSPVFRVEKAKEGYKYSFAGMIIQGGREPGMCRFIDSDVVLTAMTKLR